MRLFFRQQNPEKRKIQDIRKYVQLLQLKPGREMDTSREKLLIEKTEAHEVRRMLYLAKSNVRTALFSEDMDSSDERKRKFVELTGEEMLYDSARACRYYDHPEYLNHLVWTAKNFPCQELRIKALTQLTIIARDMNHGWHPPGQSHSYVINEILGIKGLLYNSLGVESSYVPQFFIHEPTRTPDAQFIASSFAKFIKRISVIGISATAGIAAFCNDCDLKKAVTLIGALTLAFAGGAVINRLSEAFLNESRLLESFIRKALREREWAKKTRTPLPP